MDDYWTEECVRCGTRCSHEYCSDCYNLGYDKKKTDEKR
jgi:hypothetical protein